MRLVSWNVNAFKSLEDIEGDLICLQEVKGRDINVQGYSVYQNKAANKGYSGVATLTSEAWAPYAVSDTLIVNGKKDDQGRFLLTDHKSLVLINVYFPYCSDSDQLKVEYKKDFHYAITNLIHSLIEQNRSIILVGDFNCTYDARDSFYSESVNEHMDSPWAKWFSNLLTDFSLVDVYRSIHPDQKDAYTCWNTKLNSRIVNQGSRIDYILISERLLDYLNFSDHLINVEGSDHCPVVAELSLKPIIDKDQLINQSIQPSIRSFFQTSEHSREIAIPRRNSGTKKQRKLNDFFQQKGEPSKEESSKDSFTEILQLNKKIKATIDEWAHSKDKEETVNQWDKLFTPKPPPKCYHNEPCKEFKTKIKGPNIGRIFYACARGGIAISKATNITEDRCNYFQWKFGKKNSSYSKIS